MIYFTKDALRILSKKLFYVKTPDGCNGIMYKQSKEVAKRVLNEKKDKYLSKCSIYLLVDRIKRTKEKDIYWLGVKNKAELEKRFFKVLEKEKLNVLYFKAKSKQRLLILSNNDIEKEKYKDVKTDDSEWPRAKAKDDDKTSALLIKKVENRKRKITDVIKLLPEITIEVAKPEIKTFAKDDTELYKISKEKIKKELEQSLPEKAKDDSDLLQLKLTAKSLQKTNIMNLKNDELSMVANNLKKFFEKSKSILKSDSLAKPLEAIISSLNIPENIDLKNAQVPEDTLDKIKNAVDEVYTKISE